ncbi:ubiquitin-like small modifier protein 1 [Halopiger djelfimassiliensis]|uniref:ubiquitin-like small modifier protein 1 n=1 Tax=Halopiger djelfimassiliensis TaxID=1293047 RepID=UPI001E481012|nr:ubiquitin-like small modifier protein 1 [Halopiger djelfimassiliensis]
MNAPRVVTPTIGTVGYKGYHPQFRSVKLECVFFGPFRDAVGEKTVRYETEAETVGELLADLESSYPALKGRLVADDEAGLAGDTVVTKNKRNVTHLEGLGTELEADDVLRLVPSVYGG